MGRRKQSNPVAKRPVGELPVVQEETKKGLVAAIWDAARQDEEHYLNQIENSGRKRVKLSKASSSLVCCCVEPPSAFESGARFLVGFVGVSVGDNARDVEILERMMKSSSMWTLHYTEDENGSTDDRTTATAKQKNKKPAKKGAK